MQRFILTTISFLMIIATINIVITKKLPQGKYGSWIEVGNLAYLIGIIFISISLYILYLLFFDKNKDKT